MKDAYRRLIIILLASGTLISAFGAAAVISQRQMRLRGTLNGLPDADLPPRQPILGVNADLTQYAPAELSENLDLIAETGFVWVRQPFYWDVIEPQPGQYDWSLYDAIVDETVARGLRLVAVLMCAPGWAASNPTAPPDDPNTFASFAAAVAGRYGGRIDVYQVWDEPNLSSGWGGWPPSPIAYAVLLEAGYKAIHAVDPEALVLTAGLAPTTETGPANLSDVLFLRALYENGAAPFFDGVAGKPYGFDTGPDDHRVHPNLMNFSRFLLLREEMERHGDYASPLWASNFGWNALPDGWSGDLPLWGQTTPEQQAGRTLDAYHRALTEWPWSGPLILDSWQPHVAPDDPHWGFALRDQNGELSLTAEAIREQAELFNTALWPGVYLPTTPLATYTGEWVFSELGADFNEQGGSAVDVPFRGDSLALILRRANFQGYLYITVDGEPPDILPQEEGRAYLILTSVDYQPHIEVIPIARGLDASQKHLARIEPEGGWSLWALVGFAVGMKVNTTGYDVLAVVLVVLTIVLPAVAIRVGRGLKWRIVLDRVSGWLASRLGDALHFVLSIASALAVWLGAALTWGGIVPDIIRRAGNGPSLLITVLTAGVFYFSPWLLLTIVALILLFVLIYARPTIGLALTVLFIPYYLLPRPLFDRAFSMVEVTSLLTLIAWAIHTVAERREKGWPTPVMLWRQMTGLDKAVGLFIAISMISLSWAILPGVAATELRQMVLEPFVIYLVLRTTPLTQRERWRIADLLILTGAAVAVVGLYQYVTRTNVIEAEAGILRLRSIYNSPNSAALFLERLVPITAAVALIGGEVRRRWLYGIAGVIMLAASILTLSKGAILLGLPTALAVVVILWAGRTGLIVTGVGVVLELLALIPLSQHPRFSGLFDFTSGTSTSFFRVQLWRSTLRMLRDHPITGVGPDQFLYLYRSRYILPSAWREPDLSTPHNILLSYWVRQGLIGLAAGIWIQVAFWRMAWTAQKRLHNVDNAARALVVGLMGAMAASLAHGLVDEAYFLIDLAYIFFVIIGLMHRLNEEAQHGSQDQQSEVAAG